MNIFDLHCDLLLYLEEDKSRTPYDPKVRCSLPQLKEGGVAVQTLAIYTRSGKGSTKRAQRQIDILEELVRADSLYLFKGEIATEQLGFACAIENASGFFEEEEELEEGFKRLERLRERGFQPLYMSLTWHEENRFGGGNISSVGIKEDGIRLLEWLSGKKIAIDFSHTSDPLAYDILNTIEKKKLDLPVLASHSNFRSIQDVQRNLPDEIAKEIANKGGIIGMNVIHDFVGNPPEKQFLRHLEHGIKTVGIDGIALGSDFFYDSDLPDNPEIKAYFFEEYGNASCYPKLIQLWQQGLSLSSEETAKLTSGNILRFLHKNTFYTEGTEGFHREPQRF